MSEEKEINIIRTIKTGKYFAASNEPFNDKELSFGARGLLAYLLSKPDGWKVRNFDLYKQTPENRTRVKHYLVELRRAGYLRRYRRSLGKGKIVWVSEVYEDRKANPDFIEGQSIDHRKIRPSKNSNIDNLSDIVSTESLVSTESESSTYSSHSPAQKDFLSDVLAHSQKKDRAGIADPTQDGNRWLQTRKEFIDIYHKRTGAWPNKGVHEPAISKLADAPDADPAFWDRVITAWVGRGYKAGNVDGMIEWYTKREIPTNGRDKNQNGRNQQPEPTSDADEIFFDPYRGCNVRRDASGALVPVS